MFNEVVSHAASLMGGGGGGGGEYCKKTTENRFRDTYSS